jgi:salicylate hydroxylase
MAMDFLEPDIVDDICALEKALKTSYRWLWHEDLKAQLCSAKKLL